ncbi:MAG TPA: hypothetical protein VFA71_00615 [Terriglobales bacterium]|nr:hypothetical protein [Terriglobales bacterium]
MAYFLPAPKDAPTILYITVTGVTLQSDLLTSIYVTAITANCEAMPEHRDGTEIFHGPKKSNYRRQRSGRIRGPQDQ